MATVGLGQALAMVLELLERGALADAEALCRRAIAAAPGSADARGVLGVVLARAGGRGADAARAFLAAAFLAPQRADAADSAQRLIEDCSRADPAILRAYACARPAAAAAWRLLGETPAASAVPPLEKLAALSRAGRLDPSAAATHFLYAGLLAQNGRTAAADAAYKNALRLDPALAAAWFNRALNAAGAPSHGDGWGEISAQAARRAAALAPADGAVQIFAARHHLARRELDAAGRALRRAVVLSPADAALWEAADAQAEMNGRPDQAATAAGRAYRLTGAAAAGARRQLMLNLTDAPYDRILAGAREWAQAHAEPSTAAAPPPAPAFPLAGRPLRVGYLVEYFPTHDAIIAALLAHHSAAATTAVYALRRPVAASQTARFAAAGLFRDCADLSAAQVADLIRADGVDVLVEGVGFASVCDAFSILARRPALVQAHFPVMTTTGLSAVGACLVDETIAPPGTEAWFVENLARLPVGYHLQPPEALPVIAPRPAAAAPVFGSFNSLNKIAAPVLRTWAEILRQIPAARLLIKAADMNLASEARLRGVLSGECGVAADRIVMRPPTRSYGEHLAVYNEIDIHLDSFPYGGVTTTIEALWMGRPTVTLTGARVLDRYASSFLRLLGLDDLAAADPAGYVAAAVALAADPTRRRKLETTLRAQTLASPLGDGPTFVAALENAYRALFAQATRAQAAR